MLKHVKTKILTVTLIVFLVFSVVAVLTPQFRFGIKPVKATTTYWQGVSSYPRTQGGSYSTAVIDDIIEVMDDYGLNIYRMTFASSINPNTYIQHYLDHCSYDLIIDYYHQYPYGTFSSSARTASIAKGLNILGNFSAYQDRIWLEPYNERTDSNIATFCQSFVDAVRDEEYTVKIVANKWNQPWSNFASVSDSLDKFYTGYHYYFKSGAWSTAESQMNTALSLGLKILNTEIGADYDEYQYFDQSEVDRVSEFMAWCYEAGVSNTIWCRYGLGNWATYQSMNLELPDIDGYHPPTVIDDDFEGYSVIGDVDDNWTRVTNYGTNTLVTSTIQGDKSLNCSTTGNAGGQAYIRKNVSLNDVYSRAYFKFHNLTSSDFYLMEHNVGTTNVARFYIGTTNKWKVYYRIGSTPSYSSSLGDTIVPGDVYCVEGVTHIHATNGFYQLWINGSCLFNVTGVNSANYGNIDNVRMGLRYCTAATVTFLELDLAAISSEYIGQQRFILTIDSTLPGATNLAIGEHFIIEDTNQTLIATPTSGYTFAAWEIDGSNETTTNSTWFVYMDENHTAKAYFDTVSNNPPEYSDVTCNNTLASRPTLFSAYWTDDYELYGYFLETNNTGTLTNGSIIMFQGGTSEWGNITINALNETVDNHIAWRIVANDTTGLEAATSWQYLTVTCYWWFTFNHTDIDNNVVDSKITWKLYNSSDLVDYTESAPTLLNGTYTLKTYYLTKQINQTSLPIAMYGNTTIDIFLQMKAWSSYYVTFNHTITDITINSQTSTNLTFTATGTGMYKIRVGVPKNASYIQKDGVNQTGWTYDSSNNVVTIDSTLSVWGISFPEGRGIHVLIEDGGSLGFQNDIDKTIVLQVIDGTLSSTVNTFILGSDTGSFSFSALSDTEITIVFVGINNVQVSGDQNNTNRVIQSGDTITVNSGNNIRIEWWILTEPWLPLMFIIGMIGLAASFAGPLYAINKIKHHEYHEGMRMGLILTVVGIAFVLAWLWV